MQARPFPTPSIPWAKMATVPFACLKSRNHSGRIEPWENRRKRQALEDRTSVFPKKLNLPFTGAPSRIQKENHDFFPLVFFRTSEVPRNGSYRGVAIYRGVTQVLRFTEELHRCCASQRSWRCCALQMLRNNLHLPRRSRKVFFWGFWFRIFRFFQHANEKDEKIFETLPASGKHMAANFAKHEFYYRVEFCDGWGKKRWLRRLFCCDSRKSLWKFSRTTAEEPSLSSSISELLLGNFSEFFSAPLAKSDSIIKLLQNLTL